MATATATATAIAQQQKLYRTLHDQIDLALYPNALRTVNKLLALDPKDRLALETRVQLQVALDRYPDALRLAHQTPLDPLTRAYCLYKLARPHEARQALEHVPDHRASQILDAQLSYRLGEYERARDLFDELASTAELDSPELADLEANLAACTAQLDFLAAVPATLANLSSTAAAVLPSVDELEARPLALVLPPSVTAAAKSRGSGAAAAAAPARGPHAASTSTLSGASAPAAPPPRARRRPRGNRFAAAAAAAAADNLIDSTRSVAAVAADTAAVAEDRWIPKRQRPSMRDALLQAKEKQRGRKRDRVMAATQGSAAVQQDYESELASTAIKGGHAGAGTKNSTSTGGSHKKKKGGRK
ncbi:hypothetical protein JCM3774_006615 [Rhodotorula dairenensis]